MITHNSFKLIIEEKNKEAQRLRNELHNTKLERDHLNREYETFFKEFFGCPVNSVQLKATGIVEVRTTSGKMLLFEIRCIGGKEEE